MQRRSLVRAAGIVGLAYLLSNLAGFLQRVIVSSRFGTGPELDAFNAALRVPDLLFTLLAGGALASAFIPIFAGHLGNGRLAWAWQLARRVAWLVFVVLSVAALVAALLAEPITRYAIAPGFDDALVALTASLMRIMLVSTVVFGVSGLLMGVLQTAGAFLAPALAPALYNLGIVFGATALFGLGIYGPAIGVVIGALLHLGVQLPSLRRVRRGSAHPSEVAPADARPVDAGDHDIRQIILLMIPRVIGLAAVQINFIVNTRLASRMSAGAVSALSIAFAIMILPQAAIAQAIGTVLFPAISAHAARGERAAFAEAITRAVNVIIALSMAASVGLIVLGEPLIALLFQRGAFDATSTAQVGLALRMFALGLVAHSVLEVVTRGFYALKDTARPVILAVLSMALNIALSLWLSDVFARAGLFAFGGLALANSIATTVEAIALFWLLKRREPGIGSRSTLIALAKSGAAAAVMGIGLLGWQALAGTGPIVTLAAVVLGALVYFAAASALRSDEARFAIGVVRRRLRR
jgi:putative peptidoglycan lipid II flippase